MDSERETNVLLVTVCKTSSEDEPDVIRIDRAKNNDVDGKQHEHVTRRPLADVVINKPVTVLPKVQPAHVEMSFTAHLLPNNNNKKNTERTEDRRIKFWFDIRELNRSKQIRQTQLYFKHLIRPEGFPKDYVGFIKKAVLLARHFPTFQRIELVLRPARPPSDSSESEQDDVIANARRRRQRAQRLMTKWEVIDDVSSDEDIEEEVIEDAIDNYITVLTPNKYDYQFLPEVPVSNKRMISFSVRARADVHIALSSVYAVTDVDTYEIVIGAAGNTKSFIRDGGEGPVAEEAITLNILDGSQFRPFWVRWSRRFLEVGEGTPGEKVFLRWIIPRNKHHSVNCLGVSTGPGSAGEWQFVEKIAADTDIAGAKGKSPRKAKIKLALLWEAKRMILQDLLEKAYPKCVKTMDLLRLSKTKVNDMMRAVSVLRKLLKTGHAIELKKGLWMASHKKPGQMHVVRDVSTWPSPTRRDAPVIAIITYYFIEKIAVDVMIENKVTYFRENDGDCSSCTLGVIAGRRVIHIKLPMLDKSARKEMLTDILAHFRSVEQVYIVGVAGGVPDYTDCDQHVRLGDVVISLPDQKSGLVYVNCNKIDKRASFYQFKTTRWTMKDDTFQGQLRRVRDLGENPSSIFRTTFDKILGKAIDNLKSGFPEFCRPSPRTDKLYGWVGGEFVPIEHPTPRSGRKHLYMQNRPNFRYGALGSGKYVSKNEKLRMDLARQSGIKAFDANCCDVLEALTSLDIRSYAIIRGTADYYDGSISRLWFPYAALAAAAYIKMFLGMLPKYR